MADGHNWKKHPEHKKIRPSRDYEDKLQLREYGEDVKRERGIERARLARERMERRQRAGKADPAAIAEMLDPKIGGLPDAIPQQVCYKEPNPDAPPQHVQECCKERSPDAIPQQERRNFAFLYRIVREDAKLEKLGMRLQFIFKDAFSNPTDVEAINKLRSDGGGEQTLYLRVMEVQHEGLVRNRNINEIGKKRSGPLPWLLPGDVICKVNDIADVEKIKRNLQTDLTMEFIIYRPSHRLLGIDPG